MIRAVAFGVIENCPQYLVLILDTLYLGTSINWIVAAGLLTSFFSLESGFINAIGGMISYNESLNDSTVKAILCCLFLLVLVAVLIPFLPFLLYVSTDAE